MTIELADLFRLQLAQQASLYNLSGMPGRRRSANQLATLFRQLVCELGVSQTLEIGAHEADFSRKIKEKLGENIRCRAFEANPNVYSRFLLQGDLRRLGVEYAHTAIGSENGLADFYIYESIQGQPEDPAGKRHSLLERIDSPTDAHYALKVPLARLDQLCASDPPESRYALWIDAEGAGLNVLRGAEGILGKTAAIYIELESEAKFAGQALDTELISFLLDRDFLPLARDFQFPRQYNTIFVKKDLLPQVEPLWHRFFQKEVRRELSFSFKLNQVEVKATPAKQEPTASLCFASASELKDAIMELPALRKARYGLGADTAVVCYAKDLELARKFYADYKPRFYVANLRKQQASNDCTEIGEIIPGMELQLFFPQAIRPNEVGFNKICKHLASLGVNNFHIERWSMEKAYRFGRKKPLTDAEWDVALHFTNALADADSQRSYMAALRANMEGDPGYLPYAAYKQYFHPEVQALPGDIVCEGGCYPDIITGTDFKSSTLDFNKNMKRQGEIYAFEPVTKTCQMLQEEYVKYPEIKVVEKALWSDDGFLSLGGSGSSAHIQSERGGDSQCACVSIDSFFRDVALPTLIKLDVEGAELEVLKGAKHTLLHNNPKLMLSIYHARQGSDWLRIPRFLLELDLPYIYYCGHHSFWFNESIVYGIKRHTH